MKGRRAGSLCSPIAGSGIVLLLILTSAFANMGFAQSNTNNPSGSSISRTNSFTWETEYPLDSLDPSDIAPPWAGTAILQNTYESLVWYNGNDSSKVIPWLAKNWTASADGSTIAFTLRDGITFADGNPLNSTAVYFSLNRFFFRSPFFAYLSKSVLFPSCCSPGQNSTQAWARTVLDKKMVTVTGPLTFDLNVIQPSGSLLYLLAGPWAAILDPEFVMSHDLDLWGASTSSYLLPYPTLAGSMNDKIDQYVKDMAATCTFTLGGSCGNSYLDLSNGGALAGTGPYEIRNTSVSSIFQFTKSRIVLTARPDYWGGPSQLLGSQRISPHFDTIYIDVGVPSSNRYADLRSAATDGSAMAVDVFRDHQFFGVAESKAWLTTGKLVSLVPNTTLYGPFTGFVTLLTQFVTNVTDSSTGKFFSFQPFADRRLRLAFADSVDLANLNRLYNSNLGKIAPNMMPPGIVPAGAYNSSDLPIYSYNLKETQNLLLAAMMNPITSFSFINGTRAPPGLFNNTFGCRALNAKEQCDNPVGRTITLISRSADFLSLNDTLPFRQQIMESMAEAINNISSVYHMGLHVSIQVLPRDQMFQEAYRNNLYVWEYAVIDEIPWAPDYLAFLSYNQGGAPLLTFNLTQMGQLRAALDYADAHNNTAVIVSLVNRITELTNRDVLFMTTIYPYNFQAITSNVRGFYYNPSVFVGGTGLYFASLQSVAPNVAGGQPFLGVPFQVLTVLVVGAFIGVVGISIYVRRTSRRSNPVLLMEGGRRLAAIMFTDIVGYTSLAQTSEKLAIELLERHRDLLRPLFVKHRGHEVKTIGDAFLVEFSSALEATECAIDMQKTLHEYNRSAPQEVLVRIGIHVGDVVEKKGDIYGDAVNIASRIEPLAKGGEICISEQVYDQIRNKVPLRMVKLEAQELRNVSFSLDVYKLELPWQQS